MSKTKQNYNSLIILFVIIYFISFITTLFNKSNNLQIYDEDMVQQLIDNIGLSNEKAQSAMNVIKKIGINKITKIKQQESSFQDYSSDYGYNIEDSFDSVYECLGNDNTQFECNFLVFIKDSEIMHICYYGYGSKTTYYTKSRGILRKTVHPYTSN